MSFTSDLYRQDKGYMSGRDKVGDNRTADPHVPEERCYFSLPAPEIVSEKNRSRDKWMASSPALLGREVDCLVFFFFLSSSTAKTFGRSRRLTQWLVVDDVNSLLLPPSGLFIQDKGFFFFSSSPWDRGRREVKSILVPLYHSKRKLVFVNHQVDVYAPSSTVQSRFAIGWHKKCQKTEVYRVYHI